MGLLNKFRLKESPKRENKSYMFLGLGFLLLGLVYLLVFPLEFISHSIYLTGYGDVPILLITCCGWLLFSFRLINHFKITNNKLFFKLIDKIYFFNIKNEVNKAFFLLSIIFITLIISVLLITKPLKREKMNEEILKDFNELFRNK